MLRAKRADEYGSEIVTTPQRYCACLTITQLLALTSFALMMYWLFAANMLGGLASSGELLFNWHPFLIALAFLCFCQSALAYRLVPGVHQTQQRVHATINTIGLALLFAAVIMVHTYKNENGDAHMLSLHSWIGVTTLTIITAQWLLGLLTFALDCCNADGRAWFMPLHKWLGVCGFVSLLANVLLGVLNRQSMLPGWATMTRSLANWIGVMTLLTGVTILYWLSPSSPVAIADYFVSSGAQQQQQGAYGTGGSLFPKRHRAQQQQHQGGAAGAADRDRGNAAGDDRDI